MRLFGKNFGKISKICRISGGVGLERNQKLCYNAPYVIDLFSNPSFLRRQESRKTGITLYDHHLVRLDSDLRRNDEEG